MRLARSGREPLPVANPLRTKEITDKSVSPEIIVYRRGGGGQVIFTDRRHSGKFPASDRDGPAAQGQVLLDFEHPLSYSDSILWYNGGLGGTGHGPGPVSGRPGLCAWADFPDKEELMNLELIEKLIQPGGHLLTTLSTQELKQLLL